MKAVIAHPDFGEDFFLNDLSHGFFNIRQTKLAPNTTKLSFFLDTLPGDNEENLKWHVESKLRANGNMEIKWMSRFLKPAPKLKDDHPLVRELSASFETATGRKAKIGPGRQSDQGLVSHYGKIPCVLFGCGRRGLDGAPHLPNEYVVIDEFLENLLTAANFAVNWCGHA
jgi:acetylornithine deacetylase/succinyl-diaminopimelate desuccinylase-like protein